LIGNGQYMEDEASDPALWCASLAEGLARLQSGDADRGQAPKSAEEEATYAEHRAEAELDLRNVPPTPAP
jgi:hypothetical protein